MIRWLTLYVYPTQAVSLSGQVLLPQYAESGASVCAWRGGPTLSPFADHHR